MAKTFRQFVKQGVSALARGLAVAGVLPRRVYVRMDGGICSQMHFYLVGESLAVKGLDVRYDTTWYAENGMDNDGKYCRNFDLLKAFPALDLRTGNRDRLRRVYISCFYRYNDYYDPHVGISWQDVSPPVYFDGYFRDSDEMFGCLFDFLFRVDTGLLPDDNIPFLETIEDSNSMADSCAVHIRRGDLARYEKAYGAPVAGAYFKKGISEILTLSPETRFYVFSDEPEWCRENILHDIDSAEITVVDVNGSDRGWCDMILMSRCHHQIASQGSMGKYAALLRPRHLRDGLVTLPPNDNSDEWLMRFGRVKILR